METQVLEQGTYVKLRNGNVAAVNGCNLVLAYLQDMHVKLAMASMTGLVTPGETVEEYNKSQCWMGGQIIDVMTEDEAKAVLIEKVFGPQPFSDIETLDDEEFKRGK